MFVQLPTEFANQASEVPQPSRVWFDTETSTFTVCDDARALNSMVAPVFDKHAMHAFNKATIGEKWNERFKALLDLSVDMAGEPPAGRSSIRRQVLSTYTIITRGLFLDNGGIVWIIRIR